MKSVEEWLRRQMLSEVLGNLFVGMLMSVVALPLVFLHTFLLWMVFRMLRGADPLSEVFGFGRLVVDHTITVAFTCFLLWFATYLIWARKREDKGRFGGRREDDPGVLDFRLIVTQISFAAPAAVMTALSFFSSMRAWALMDVANCSAVLKRLLASPHRVALETLRGEISGADWDAILRQLKLIPGVVFLPSRPAGLSLTGELRQTLLKGRRTEEWNPPPREERFEFVCARCGQRLRLRRFQNSHSIRCAQCKARYRVRLDLRGGMRIEPEPEQRRRAQATAAAPGINTHYQTLELKAGADLQTVRRAYRQMMKRHHPDLYATESEAKRIAVEEKAKRINEAYHALMDHLEGKS